MFLSPVMMMFRLGLSVMLGMLAGLAPNAPHAQTRVPEAGFAPAVILVLGDSLSAEYGLPRGTGWVALLAARLAEHHPGYRVVNASVSGETSAGGVTRLPSLLAEHRPALVILELGSNDALRGLALDSLEHNLDTMTQAARAAGAKVQVVGMQIPPNYGRAYTERLRTIYAQVAARHQAAYTPFLLAGIAQDPTYFQNDRLHPNQPAQPLLLENIWPALVTLL